MKGKHQEGECSKEAIISSYAPLKKTIIYLDVVDQKRVSLFEPKLLLLGAVVEKCFSREITHLITDKGSPLDYGKESRSTSPRVTSPSNPSPFAASTARYSGGQPVESPKTDSPGNVDSVRRPASRAEAIVNRVNLTKRYGSSNVIDCAHTWNIKILHIVSAEDWVQRQISKLPRKSSTAKVNDNKIEQPASDHIIPLTGLYIKIEDVNRKYRPVRHIFDRFPSLNLDMVATLELFDCHKARHQPELDRHKDSVSRQNIRKNVDQEIVVPEVRQKRWIEMKVPEASNAWRKMNLQTLRQKKCSLKSTNNQKKVVCKKWPPQPHKTQQRDKSSHSQQSKIGCQKNRVSRREQNCAKLSRVVASVGRCSFCEICNVRYSNLAKHLLSSRHREFVCDSKNYLELDTVIADLSDFEKLLSHRKNSRRTLNYIPNEEAFAAASIKTMPTVTPSEKCEILAKISVSKSCNEVTQNDSRTGTIFSITTVSDPSRLVDMGNVSPEIPIIPPNKKFAFNVNNLLKNDGCVPYEETTSHRKFGNISETQSIKNEFQIISGSIVGGSCISELCHSLTKLDSVANTVKPGFKRVHLANPVRLLSDPSIMKLFVSEVDDDNVGFNGFSSNSDEFHAICNDLSYVTYQSELDIPDEWSLSDRNNRSAEFLNSFASTSQPLRKNEDNIDVGVKTGCHSTTTDADSNSVSRIEPLLFSEHQECYLRQKNDKESGAVVNIPTNCLNPTNLDKISAENKTVDIEPEISFNFGSPQRRIFLQQKLTSVSIEANTETQQLKSNSVSGPEIVAAPGTNSSNETFRSTDVIQCLSSDIQSNDWSAGKELLEMECARNDVGESAVLQANIPCPVLNGRDIVTATTSRAQLQLQSPELMCSLDGDNEVEFNFNSPRQRAIDTEIEFNFNSPRLRSLLSPNTANSAQKFNHITTISRENDNSCSPVSRKRLKVHKVKGRSRSHVKSLRFNDQVRCSSHMDSEWVDDSCVQSCNDVHSISTAVSNTIKLQPMVVLKSIEHCHYDNSRKRRYIDAEVVKKKQRHDFLDDGEVKDCSVRLQRIVPSVVPQPGHSETAFDNVSGIAANSFKKQILQQELKQCDFDAAIANLDFKSKVVEQEHRVVKPCMVRLKRVEQNVILEPECAEILYCTVTDVTAPSFQDLTSGQVLVPLEYTSTVTFDKESNADGEMKNNFIQLQRILPNVAQVEDCPELLCSTRTDIDANVFQQQSSKLPVLESEFDRDATITAFNFENADKAREETNTDTMANIVDAHRQESDDLFTSRFTQEAQFEQDNNFKNPPSVDVMSVNLLMFNGNDSSSLESAASDATIIDCDNANNEFKSSAIQLQRVPNIVQLDECPKLLCCTVADIDENLFQQRLEPPVLESEFELDATVTATFDFENAENAREETNTWFVAKNSTYDIIKHAKHRIVDRSKKYEAVENKTKQFVCSPVVARVIKRSSAGLSITVRDLINKSRHGKVDWSIHNGSESDSMS